MRPIFSLRILALCEEFDDSGYSRRLTTIVNFLKPVFLVINKNMKKSPLKKDVMREPNRMSRVRVL